MATDYCLGGSCCLAHLCGDSELRDGTERRRRRRGCPNSAHESSSTICIANSVSASCGQSSSARDGEPAKWCSGFASSDKSSAAADDDPAK